MHITDGMMVLAVLAFIAWFPFTAYVIDRAYNPKVDCVFDGEDRATVNGVRVHRYGRRWFLVEDGKELSYEYSKAIDKAAREHAARRACKNDPNHGWHGG